MIKLRPHHLLCCLTFSGKGYTQAFIDNYYQIIGRLKKQEKVKIVASPDDICSPVCQDKSHHCFESRITARDQAVLEDFERYTDLHLKVDSIIEPNLLFNDEIQKFFKQDLIRTGCIDCQWKDLCDLEAENNFSSAVLNRKEV
ncbi:DUF1284 domain-containing protein [Vibrio sp. SS-MA-C1-2]|uniref:DUF1284 domain-containing protein n=1 Tax=Vibrio sp. SS-MA-C1-2 TaxID=2908646 RepID=UPI001F41104E|nr:DUF1284 domain-containing protein [Vibrio sp. SS-MA-C1-2]UJF17191.1 DUF1284 domain-containing protein [Vibrio sp. SS-MA-C1-2]